MQITNFRALGAEVHESQSFSLAIVLPNQVHIPVLLVTYGNMSDTFEWFVGQASTRQQCFVCSLIFSPVNFFHGPQTDIHP